MIPIIPASGLLFAESLPRLISFAPRADTGTMPTVTPRKTFSISNRPASFCRTTAKLDFLIDDDLLRHCRDRQELVESRNVWAPMKR